MWWVYEIKVGDIFNVPKKGPWPAYTIKVLSIEYPGPEVCVEHREFYGFAARKRQYNLQEISMVVMDANPERVRVMNDAQYQRWLRPGRLRAMMGG